MKEIGAIFLRAKKGARLTRIVSIRFFLTRRFVVDIIYTEYQMYFTLSLLHPHWNLRVDKCHSRREAVSESHGSLKEETAGLPSFTFDMGVRHEILKKKYPARIPFLCLH